MSQSSLLAWLNKPGAVNSPTPASNNVRDDASRPREIPPTPQPSTTPSKSSTPQNDLPNLPANVTLRPCTRQDIPALKNLHALLLPIPYPDSFYREILEDAVTHSITLVATWHDNPTTARLPNSPSREGTGKLVGAIRCRLLAHDLQQNPSATNATPSKGPMLYLSTILVASPYRSHGIATRLLDATLLSAVDDYAVRSVGAHVWEANEAALEWYAKRGFETLGKEEGYYRRLKPQGAVVVRRRVGVGDLLGRAAGEE